MSLSVLMSIYADERADYLQEALQSLAWQTLKAQELILVEDGRVPAALKEVISRYREVLNIKSVNIDRPGGLPAALNTGLKRCGAELIARMDADDIALPDRFEKQVAFMEQNKEISVSSGWVEEFDETGKTVSYRKLPLLSPEIEQFAKRRSPINHPAAIFRKKDVLEVGGYPLLKKCQDYALFSLMLQNSYKLANIPEVLLRMRMTDELFKRRGKGISALLSYQKRLGFISTAELIENALIRSVVCVSPVTLRKRFYRALRRQDEIMFSTLKKNRRPIKSRDRKQKL